MSEKNKNGKNNGPDFLRYHSEKMTEKERNAFERELQKDPFAEEASEGFSNIDPEAAERDLEELNRMIRRRVSGGHRKLWYSVAASITILMAISVVLLLKRTDNRIEEIAYNQPETRPGEITIQKEEPLKEIVEPEAGEAVASAPFTSEPGANQPLVMADDQAAPGKDKPQETIKKEEIAVAHDAVRQVEIQEARPAVMAEKSAKAKAASADRSALPSGTISGRVISSEDNLPLPGATILIKGTKHGTVSDENGNFVVEGVISPDMILVASYLGMDSKEFKPLHGAGNEIKLDPSALALNEVVVVGYGVSGNTSDTGVSDAGYSPPVPVTGHKEFNRYISENMVIPDTITSGQKNVVVLSFRVKVDGKIDSIEVVRSPGRIFSEEAIRLLKEGPEWKPAISNGKTTEDKIRIRIVFK